MNRNPSVTSIAAASLALGMMMPTAYQPAQRVKPLAAEPDRQPKSRQWTCKRCGEKFTPHRSPTYCDKCQSVRMGEPQSAGHRGVTRDKARDAIRVLSMNQIPVNPYVLAELFRIAEWPLPEAVTEQLEVISDKDTLSATQGGCL